MCKLCDLVQKRDIKTRLYWENDRLMMVDCETCGVPMIVLKDHKADFPEADQMVHLFYAHADKGADMRNWEVDFNMRQIVDHWHCHLRRRG